MKLALSIFAAASLLAGTAIVNAESSTINKAPGQQMQERGSVKGAPGASGYAPGQKMQERGSRNGSPGASGYAPGHSTTGSGDRTRSRGTTDTDMGGDSHRR
jgi:hypothetical protein